VTPYGGHERFFVGRPDSWYGQAIDENAKPASLSPSTLRKLRARAFLGRPIKPSADIIDVPALPLYDVLAPLPPVDLIDMDIQGAEFGVIRRSIGILDDKVKRLHIGTHSTHVEDRLRTLLGGREWILERDYPCGTTQDTPYGPVTFQDGVQSWVNRRTKWKS
jgi:hypothetical protein